MESSSFRYEGFTLGLAVWGFGFGFGHGRALDLGNPMYLDVLFSRSCTFARKFGSWLICVLSL